MLIRLILVMAMIAVVRPACAAEITLMATGDHSYPVVTISGKLTDTDDDNLAVVLRQARDQGAGSIFLRLNSPGGSVRAGISITERLDTYKRESHASVITVVGDNEMCASACFLIWLSGSVSTSGISTQFGVHGASSSLTGQQDIGALAVTTMMAKFFHDHNVPDDIIGRMVVAPPSDMVWLKLGDLERVGNYRNLDDLKLRESAQALVEVHTLDVGMQTSVRQGNGSSAASFVPTLSAAAPPTIAAPIAYLDGRRDRVAYDTWFETLQDGSYKQGALFWASNRSLKDPSSCRSFVADTDWDRGCRDGQTRLALSDLRRRSEPDYKTGWNSL